MYIRTKDGVYLKIRECDENNKILIVGKTITDFGTYIEKKDIINQSESLEELCDGFYIEESEEDTFIKEYSYEVDKFDNFKQYYLYAKKHWLYPPQNAYGFIKTSKGLIYVAKMNDDGKLVLI